MTLPPDFWPNLGSDIFSSFVAAFAVGWALIKVGERSEEKKLKADAIRDLMAYRGDFANAEFRRSLNKVSLVFHLDEEIREDVRSLYEVMRDENSKEERIKRSIVGLIYKLCQKNGFEKLTEYDIDQSFPESRQTPDVRQDNQVSPAPTTPSPTPPSTPTTGSSAE